MNTCFTLLMTVVAGQFLYPAKDKFPNAECAWTRDKWVESKLSKYNRVPNSVMLSDNTYPDCDYHDGQYVAKQCKILGQHKTEYCRCVNKFDGETIMIFSDSNRTLLKEFSYSNFPVLFQDAEFSQKGCKKAQRFMKGPVKRKLSGVIPSVGGFCNPTFTNKKACISKKTGTCTQISSLIEECKLERSTSQNCTESETMRTRCDKSWQKPLKDALRPHLRKNKPKEQTSTKR